MQNNPVYTKIILEEDILAQRSEQAKILARSAPIINLLNFTIMARRRRNRRRGRRRSSRKYFISRGGIRL